MKANNFTLKVGTIILLIVSAMGAMGQTNDSPTQEVCPGIQPYLIRPGNATNTFLWSIGSGVSGTDWTIESPTTAATTITWGPTTTAQTYIVTFREVDPVTNCYDEVTLQVTVNPAPEAPTGLPITACETNPLQPITATATAPAGANVVWYDAATGGNVVADPTLSTVGTVTYYAESQLGSCISSTRTPIVLTITPAPEAPTAEDQIVCELSPVQTLTATATAPTGATVVWFDAATGGNVVDNPTLNAVGSVTYYAESQIGTCISSTRTPVTLTIEPAPIPTIGGLGELCALTEGTIYNTEAGMTNYVWTVSPGGTITAGGGLNDNTVTVTWNTAGAQTISVNYQNANGCAASTATISNITVSPAPNTSPIYHN